MPAVKERIPLISSAYSGRSVIASGQECVNLYAEINEGDPQAPVQVIYYPTPGLDLYAENSEYLFKARGTYRTSVGTAYYVVGQNVYFVGVDNTLTVIGIIADRDSLIKFTDNGLVVLLVDGVNGYVIEMGTNNFAPIVDPNFYGADWVDLLDTFFILNRPDTNQFYITVSNASFLLLSTVGAFDPLDIAAKSGFNDPIISLAAIHGELWLVGNLTTEIWVGTGAADFYFQRQQGAFVNHGSGAVYGMASLDVLIFYLMQDKQGNGIVVQGQGYDVSEISTPRTVDEFKTYATMEDAIGFCFQVGDHAFYCLVFPTASKGWMYDLKTKQWNEWNWCDENGNLLRPRINCCMFAFNKILGGDWENGKLYEITLNSFTDDGSPIVRTRTFPHSVENNNKVTYLNFEADIEPGTIVDQEDDPEMSLSWSDDKGKTYGNPIKQSMGKTGKYLKSLKWNNLGEARDRVFKLSWSTNNKTALNGGFTTRKKARA